MHYMLFETVDKTWNRENKQTLIQIMVYRKIYTWYV